VPLLSATRHVGLGRVERFGHFRLLSNVPFLTLSPTPRRSSAAKFDVEHSDEVIEEVGSRHTKKRGRSGRPEVA
jgi:hypothetical protein